MCKQYILNDLFKTLLSLKYNGRDTYDLHSMFYHISKKYSFTRYFIKPISYIILNNIFQDIFVVVNVYRKFNGSLKSTCKEK